jgi:hypothetical protein
MTAVGNGVSIPIMLHSGLDLGLENYSGHRYLILLSCLGSSKRPPASPSFIVRDELDN